METEAKLIRKVTFSKVEKLFLTSYLKGCGRNSYSWKDWLAVTAQQMNLIKVVAYFDGDGFDQGVEVTHTEDMRISISNYLRQVDSIDPVMYGFDFQKPNLYYNKFIFGSAVYQILRFDPSITEVIIPKRGQLKPGEYYGTLKVISYDEKRMITYSIKIVITDKGAGVVLTAEPLEQTILNSDVLATSLDNLINSMRQVEVSKSDHEYDNNCMHNSRDLHDSLEDEER